jgi:hypothetical protein
MMRRWAPTMLRWIVQSPSQMMLVGVCIGTWWCVVPVLAPRFLGAVGLGVAGLRLSGSPDSLSLPVN